MSVYTEARAGAIIRLQGTVYEVVDAVFSKKNRQKGTNQVRLKNLATGAVTAKTLHAADTLELVTVEKRPLTFIYARNGVVWLRTPDNPKERFSVAEPLVQGVRFLIEGVAVTGLYDGEKLLSVIPPIKVCLRVREAPPEVRGDTAQGGTKRVTLETGAHIATPLFIQTGDVLCVNTETGAYVERVEKR